jgi:hypothetical protein
LYVAIKNFWFPCSYLRIPFLHEQKCLAMHIFMICHWYNYSADDMIEDQQPEPPIIPQNHGNMNAREVL